MHHIQPGKPDQDALIERSKRTEVRDVTATWLTNHNTSRLRDSLGRVRRN